MISYFVRIATLASQFINTVFLLGNPDVTVSARCYMNRHKRYWRTAYRAINSLFFWQIDHCRSSFCTDVYHARHVADYAREDSTTCN